MDVKICDLALGWERVSCQGTVTCLWMPHRLWWLPPLHCRLVLLSECEGGGDGMFSWAPQGTRSYSRKSNELNLLQLPAWCGGLSHTQLELREDMPAEWGCAEAQAGMTVPHCCLACVCPMCAGSAEHHGVYQVCAHVWAQTACCTLVCAVTPVAPVSLCILGSVCCVTTPGLTFQLSNGGFCPCPSHVDVSVGIHTPALHIYNPCVMHVPGPAQLLPGPAQAFWGRVTCVTMVTFFATVAFLSPLNC